LQNVKVAFDEDILTHIVA